MRSSGPHATGAIARQRPAAALRGASTLRRPSAVFIAIQTAMASAAGEAVQFNLATRELLAP